MAYENEAMLTTDNRIRTYRYNPNDVYLLVIYSGFQSSIEFAKDETVETIAAGDSYAWQMTPLGNRIFIKSIERNIRTNVTIITNKRTYQIDLASKELEDGDENDLVYVMRFQYPKRLR
ncbi:TrbG/VirB9 family P-type conjugative transfer protein [Rickettsiaceae bacterium]|nr:TrbG/VirB9 family P-type conjugative transfer protein [Rickettsiaceae bacterium]